MTLSTSAWEILPVFDRQRYPLHCKQQLFRQVDDSMNIAEIVKQLKSERERLTSAIQALEGIEGGSQGAARNGSKPATEAKAAKHANNGLTPAGRKRLSELMKKRWADKRKKTAPAKTKK
jgi:hypothetical protein